MYNRYIPQPDGTYRRNRLPDQAPPRQRQQPKRPPEPPPEPPESAQQPCRETPQEPPRKPQTHQVHQQENFLQRLLPKDFDTGDLIVALLLLLMAGDSQESKNNAILTLALYFMM